MSRGTRAIRRRLGDRGARDRRRGVWSPTTHIAHFARQDDSTTPSVLMRPEQPLPLQPEQPLPLQRRRPFADTAMGRLPNELLVQIGHYLGRGHQTVIARVSQRLRKVGEEILYPEIDLFERLYHQQTEVYTFDPKQNELMLLHRTLTSCSHLAKLVRRFHICLEFYETMDIEAPFHSTLRRPDPFMIFTRIAVKEALCASSLIFDIKDGLEDVIIETKNPMDYPFKEDDFFERFDLDSASMLNRVALCKLKSLKYDGPRFNHVLASLPVLVRLSLNNTSLMSMRRRPTSIPNNLKELSILSLSWLLNPRAEYYANYSNFTKHFLSLKKVFICIGPRRSDNDDAKDLVGLYKNRITVGQFDALVAPLRCSQDSLEILDMMSHLMRQNVSHSVALRTTSFDSSEA